MFMATNVNPDSRVYSYLSSRKIYLKKELNQSEAPSFDPQLGGTSSATPLVAGSAGLDYFCKSQSYCFRSHFHFAAYGW